MQDILSVIYSLSNCGKASMMMKCLKKKRFVLFFLFIYEHLLKLIFNGESRCCNSTFTDVLFISLLTKSI